LQLGSSIGTSLVSMVGGAQLLALSDMEKIVSQVPLDPFITLGLITFSCGGVGWLLGPIVGTGIFNTMNGKHRTEMAAVCSFNSPIVLDAWELVD
jgi:import inner membrane translocase subunit TIM23